MNGTPRVVAVIPLRDGPWQAVVFDTTRPCEGTHAGRSCHRQRFARHRWLDASTGRVLCGVCRWETTRQTPDTQRLDPGMVDAVQLTIEAM